MKKRKPAGPEPGEESRSRQDAAADVNVVRWAEREPSRSCATGPPLMGPEALGPEALGPEAMRAPEAMGPEAVTPGSAHNQAHNQTGNHTLNHKVKRRGRLDRAVLAMLGKGLEDCFDEVRKQEVPERFKLLLRQF
ncbi:MAG TPA: hypothetical protein VGI22_18010 [Xanthobacteraceae bacterium]